jgi:chemotaxis protein methyltransferase CheR
MSEGLATVAPGDFDYLRAFLRAQSAIVLDQGKEYLVATRLAPLMLNEGYTSLGDLLHGLRSSQRDLPRKVLEAMTNHETWFYRDFQPFEALRREVLPRLLAARGEMKALRFWSAACSTGQEPYSLAILLRENFSLPQWNVHILATDISTQALHYARAGRYSQIEVNRGLPITLLMKYFRGVELDFELVPEVRGSVEFRQLNLAQPWPDLPRMDVVLLRNVMIYFDVEDRKRILAKLRNCLQPDGVLFLGCAETTLNLSSEFERISFEKTAYYRVKS